MTKQGGEHITASSRAELKREILNEVLSLETVMRMLYLIFGTMHKLVLQLNGWHKCYTRRAHIFSNLDTVINRI